MPENRANKMASAVKQVGTAKSIHSLFTSIIFSVILILLALLLLFLGIPWYIGVIMLVFAVGIILFEIIALRRTTKVNLDTLNEPVPEEIALEQGEVVTDTIPAVMQYLKARSVSVQGIGKVLTPANALIITNKAVWALTVPLKGTDKVVGGVDIGKNQWMWASKDIGDKLQEMLSTLPLEDVLREGRAQRLMGWEEFRLAKSRRFSRDICLVKSDGRKYRYSIRQQEDYLRAREIFKIG